MNLPANQRQGFLGDFTSKTVPELKELLERQEKILEQTAFLNRLQDKGEKNRRFAERLRELIKHREHSDEIVTVKSSGKSQAPVKDITESTTAFSISPQKLIEEDLASRLQNVQICEAPSKTTVTENSVTNSYERVIKKAEASNHKRKSRFLPNRTLKSGTQVVQPSTLRDNDSRSTKESAAEPPLYKFQEAKLISVEESVQLINEQRRRNEELMAEQAALRLAAQLTPKMTVYSPETTDLSYREARNEIENESIDSDDFEEQEEDEDGNS